MTSLPAVHAVAAPEALAELDAVSAASAPTRPHLLGSTVAELDAFSDQVGGGADRGRQIFTWAFNHRVTSFAAMNDLPKRLRAALAEHFDLGRPHLDVCQVSRDGTRKYRFVAADNTAFEAVYIPEVSKGGKTNTLCISSQSGCAVGCKFCFTASLKRNRNLTAGEIVGQMLAVRDDVAALGDGAKVTNIVFMGMGEPLLNYANVVRAARTFMNPFGAGISSRRVTVSTSGIVPRIYDLGRDAATQLAVSLNATTDAVRTAIMPINKKWPLATLLAAMRAYPLAAGRRITVEYVLLGGINDSVADAERLKELLVDIPVKLNLLPLNPHDRTPFTPPTPQAVEDFQNTLRRAGFHALLRTPRGQDIAAACGQLGESIGALA